KLCELDVPMHIHATGSHSPRSPYTLHFINEESIAVYGLVHSDVFKDFPHLKVICSHGGGSIPYQIGRFQSSAGRRGLDFLDGMRNLYYDTVLYTEESLRLLIKTVGADRCLFGSECPGVGSTIDPSTGRLRDDVRPVIESFAWLSADEKRMIFEGNARHVFGLKV
ncbi:MAG: amidohydrolase family protein, partial [Hydrogenophaga sp.]|nr:amidohydrolase family protein [Hydrogenophaga sp.]